MPAALTLKNAFEIPNRVWRTDPVSAGPVSAVYPGFFIDNMPD